MPLTRRNFLLSSASAIAVTAAFVPLALPAAKYRVHEYWIDAIQLPDGRKWVSPYSAARTIFVNMNADGANDGTSLENAYTSIDSALEETGLLFVRA